MKMASIINVGEIMAGGENQWQRWRAKNNLTYGTCAAPA
jgi:hypothetical protein